MKKNLISVAVAASVAGASAQAAMYINPDKTGSVLLFPYYNAQNGNETSMHIVNTTDEAKAVKVRFMEYVNSTEVLDFNLYLSKRDHFSFTIFKNPKGDGGAIITRDNSCTVPALGDPTAGVPGSQETNADGSITRIQPFLNYGYATDGDKSYSRSLAGHVEVIEMGVLNNGTATADKYKTFATHGATGVPANCAGLVKAWSTGGTWKDTDKNDGITAATGGLYGLSNILNAADAAAFGVEPAAIESFWAASEPYNHTNPGDLLPSLSSGSKFAIVPNGGESYTLSMETGVDAVSALFMTKSISNDVMINSDIGGLTDWVVTFPTRRYYVDPVIVGTAAERPFTDLYVKKTADSSCEPVIIKQWDREEAYVDYSETPIFSPAPPQAEDTPNKLCYETNTVHIDPAASALNANAVYQEFSQGTEGWQEYSFVNAGHVLPTLGSNDRAGGRDLKGLPAMGFAAYKYVNGDRSYGFVADHKTDTVGSAVSSI